MVKRSLVIFSFCVFVFCLCIIVQHGGSRFPAAVFHKRPFSTSVYLQTISFVGVTRPSLMYSATTSGDFPSQVPSRTNPIGPWPS